MNEAEIKAIIQQKLPEIISQDPLIRDFILRTVSNYYAGKEETESKFDRILAELQQDREEQARKWDEQNRKWDQFTQEQARKWDEQNSKWDEQNSKWDEQNRKWDEQNRKWYQFTQEQARKWDEQNSKWEEQNSKWEEQNRKWDEQNRKWDKQNSKWDKQNSKWDKQNSKWEEQNRKWDEQNRKWDENSRRIDQILQEIKNVNRKYDSTIGALGSRWGLYTEASFRNGLRAILQDSFGVEVINFNDFDPEGEVFGRPDQVEIDVIVKNGLVILCEIKSSMSKSDMYTFDRKVAFYEKCHQKTADRKLVISPMVDPQALTVAENLGIEVYSYADSVQNL